MRGLLSLPDVLIDPVVRHALAEDLGRAGDITTAAIVPSDCTLATALVAREAGVVAGLDCARRSFELVDATLACETLAAEGRMVAAGDILMRVSGAAGAILAAERVALNLLCRQSGIASATAKLVACVQAYDVGVTCTRKTTPGLRVLEKRAVRAGGGRNHRFGLDDAILIKDNHIAAAGGIDVAMSRARQAAGHLVKIEIEVDTLDQLAAALPWKPDAVLLDNMSPETLRRAVEMAARTTVLEASGGVTLDSAPAIAATGIDLISAGWLTQGAPALDIGLDVT